MRTWDEAYQTWGPQPLDTDDVIAGVWKCEQDHHDCESLKDCIATLEADADELESDAQDLEAEAYEKRLDACELCKKVEGMSRPPAAPIPAALPVPMLVEYAP